MLGRFGRMGRAIECRIPFAVLLLSAPGMLWTSQAAPRAAELHSTALAKELMRLMAAAKLEAIAAKDAAAGDRFVAALVFEHEQLLVVSARHPSPLLLEPLLASGAFRDVYTALQGGGMAEGKLFVHDLGADGLREDRGESVDIVYEEETHQTVFDGSAAKKGKLAKVDAQYSRILTLLISQLQTASATTLETNTPN